MTRFAAFFAFLLPTLTLGAALAAPGSVVFRPSGAKSASARSAMLTSGVKRARIAKSEIFATDEMRVRLPGGLVGKNVHVTQGASTHATPATALFQAFQSVEAAHAGHAGAVHVTLDAATRELYGEQFLAAMFKGLDVDSLAFADGKGARTEATLLDEKLASHGDLSEAPMAVWTGSSHPALGASLAKKLHVEEIKVEQGKNGKLSSASAQQVAGKRIVLVQTKRMGNSERFHSDLLEMLHGAYEAKRNGAASVMVVSPYMAYSRSDRMDTSGTSVGAAILPQLMKRAGVDDVVFYSIHQAQEVGIFQALHIKTAHAAGEQVLASRIAEHLVKTDVPLETLKVLAPDAGAAKRARVFAKFLEKSLNRPAGSIDVVIANKERNGNVAKVRFEGDVTGATIIAIDDETASGSTMKQNADAARANGARAVLGAVSHLTGAAHKTLTGSSLDRLFVLDTLPQDELQKTTGHPIEVIPIADHLAKVVSGLNTGKNVDKLLFFEH